MQGDVAVVGDHQIVGQGAQRAAAAADGAGVRVARGVAVATGGRQLDRAGRDAAAAGIAGDAGIDPAASRGQADQVAGADVAHLDVLAAGKAEVRQPAGDLLQVLRGAVVRDADGLARAAADGDRAGAARCAQAVDGQALQDGIAVYIEVIALQAQRRRAIQGQRAASGRRADRTAGSRRQRDRGRADRAGVVQVVVGDVAGRHQADLAGRAGIDVAHQQVLAVGRECEVQIARTGDVFQMNAVGVVRQREGRQVGCGDGVRAVGRTIACDGQTGQAAQIVGDDVATAGQADVGGLQGQRGAGCAQHATGRQRDAAGLDLRGGVAVVQDGTRTVGKRGRSVGLHATHRRVAGELHVAKLAARRQRRQLDVAVAAVQVEVAACVGLHVDLARAAHAHIAYVARIQATDRARGRQEDVAAAGIHAAHAVTQDGTVGRVQRDVVVPASHRAGQQQVALARIDLHGVGRRDVAQRDNAGGVVGARGLGQLGVEAAIAGRAGQVAGQDVQIARAGGADGAPGQQVHRIGQQLRGLVAVVANVAGRVQRDAAAVAGIDAADRDVAVADEAETHRVAVAHLVNRVPADIVGDVEQQRRRAHVQHVKIVLALVASGHRQGIEVRDVGGVEVAARVQRQARGVDRDEVGGGADVLVGDKADAAGRDARIREAIVQDAALRGRQRNAAARSDVAQFQGLVAAEHELVQQRTVDLLQFVGGAQVVVDVEGQEGRGHQQVVLSERVGV
ncbi:hypothetical protein D3C72_851730 [compost metagenome]